MAKKKAVKVEAPKKEAAPKEPKKETLIGKSGEDNPGSGVKIQ